MSVGIHTDRGPRHQHTKNSTSPIHVAHRHHQIFTRTFDAAENNLRHTLRRCSETSNKMLDDACAGDEAGDLAVRRSGLAGLPPLSEYTAARASGILPLPVGMHGGV
jgi:hypothetical protein